MFSVLRIDSDEMGWDSVQLPDEGARFAPAEDEDGAAAAVAAVAAGNPDSSTPASRKAAKKNAKRRAARERRRAEVAKIADAELCLKIESGQQHNDVASTRAHAHTHTHDHASAADVGTHADAGDHTDADEHTDADDYTDGNAVASNDGEGSSSSSSACRSACSEPLHPVELVECFTIQAGTGRMPVIAPEDVWDSFKLLPVQLRRVSTRLVCGHAAEAGGSRSRGDGKRRAAGGASSTSKHRQDHHQHGPGCHQIQYLHEPSGQSFKSQRALLQFIGAESPWHVDFAECFECGLSVMSSRLHLHKRIEHPEAYQASQDRRQEAQDWRREREQLQRQARLHPSPSRMLRTHILDDPIAQALADNEDMELQRALLADAAAAAGCTFSG